MEEVMRDIEGKNEKIRLIKSKKGNVVHIL